jgi:hypothetical protein
LTDIDESDSQSEYWLALEPIRTLGLLEETAEYSAPLMVKNKLPEDGAFQNVTDETEIRSNENKRDALDG